MDGLLDPAIVVVIDLALADWLVAGSTVDPIAVVGIVVKARVITYRNVPRLILQVILNVSTLNGVTSDSVTRSLISNPFCILIRDLDVRRWQ